MKMIEKMKIMMEEDSDDKDEKGEEDEEKGMVEMKSEIENDVQMMSRRGYIVLVACEVEK